MSTNTGMQMLYVEDIIKCLIDWLKVNSTHAVYTI
jgi:hypothetical protein